MVIVRSESVLSYKERYLFGTAVVLLNFLEIARVKVTAEGYEFAFDGIGKAAGFAGFLWTEFFHRREEAEQIINISEGSYKRIKRIDYY